MIKNGEEIYSDILIRTKESPMSGIVQVCYTLLTPYQVPMEGFPFHLRFLAPFLLYSLHRAKRGL